ncbi:hypothetical protein [Methylobacterium sp. Gmos1]
MSLAGTAQLLGAIRIVPDVDSIGIAVFGVPGENTMYVGETDASFKITEFMDFINAEGFQIDYNLPEDHQLLSYTLGEPSPIPFWVNGFCHIIPGDAESNDVFVRFDNLAIDHPVLKTLRRLLGDARNGVFQEQQDQWMVEEIAASFSDIFERTPVHSRYWITRLGDAVRHARSLTEPPHPIDEELRRIALEWIERFATKTDYQRLMAVIGNLLEGAISAERAQAMVFGFLVNQVMAGNFNTFAKELGRDKRFTELFPNGIYQYWWRHNWPRLTFNYNKPDFILDPLLWEIRHGAAREDFHRAERLSYLYFRWEQAPAEIHERVVPLIQEYLKKLSAARYRADEIMSNPLKYKKWDEAARRVLYFYFILMSLDGIIDGNHRLSRVIIKERFGLSSTYVKELAERLDLQL